ncbi:MAG: polysaccharide pyruvyl transferase family protein [bacterium]
MSDVLLRRWTGAVIEGAKRGPARPWRPGQPLDLLIAGYNGARNTGSDVRVEEMVRQIEHVLGPDRVRISVLTQDFRLTEGYFGRSRQVKLPDVFPPFLAREVPRHHGVIAAEGSMFKSRFADALTTMMVGALGVASARNGISIGYGAEAGDMHPGLERLVRRHCGSSLVITRNRESETRLRALGVPVEPGTDTAWTFEPRGAERADTLLRAAGWDGSTPILGLCPINPFWWPVRPSILKGAARLFGAYRESHYRSIYFHRAGADVDAAYDRYLSSIANAVTAYRRERQVFPVLVAMEALDQDACERVAARLDGAPVFASGEHDMHTLVSILRRCDRLVSSRFHAIVTSMPALVPSAGITMDERIRNLMHERGHEHLLLTVDDPALEERLLGILHRLDDEAESMRDDLGRTVADNLVRMARMGAFLEAEVARRFAEFPVREGLVPWREYLPPLSPGLEALAARWATDAPVLGTPHRSGVPA